MTEKQTIPEEKTWEDRILDEVVGTEFTHSKWCKSTELIDYKCNCGLKGDVKGLLDLVQELLHLERQRVLDEVREKVEGLRKDQVDASLTTFDIIPGRKFTTPNGELMVIAYNEAIDDVLTILKGEKMKVFKEFDKEKHTAGTLQAWVMRLMFWKWREIMPGVFVKK